MPVVRFEPIPWERLRLQALRKQRVFSHRLDGDELVLDLDYEFQVSLGSRGAAALWNLKTKRWRVIAYPAPNSEYFASHGGGLMNETGVYVELFGGALYLSERTGLFKFDLRGEQWEPLPVPQPALSQLRAIGGRLYAGNGESLFEILEGGARITLLASSRRRPAVTALDNLESLNIRAIFPSANGALRVAARDGVYEWNGRDWTQLFPLAEQGMSAEVLGDCVLFRKGSGFNSFRTDDEVRILWPNATNSQLCWTPPPSRSNPLRGMMRPAQASITPFTQLKPAVASRLAATPMAVQGSNIFCFVETADAAKVDRRWQVTDVLGRHAELYVLGANRPKPVVIPLRFDLTRGPFPSDFTEPREGRLRLNRTWLEVAGGQLLIGQGTTAGIWQLPMDEIESRIRAEDERRQSAAIRLAARQKEARRRADANGDGTLQPEEKERALADLEFLRSSLSEYQPRPGWPMTPENLRWFDANGDHVLQPVEEAACTNAELLVVQQIIEGLDENEDGALQRHEVVDDLFGREPVSNSNFAFADTDQDQFVTAGELAAMFRNSLLQSLRQGARGPRNMPGFARPPAPGEQSFKDLVEACLEEPARNSPPFGSPPRQGVNKGAEMTNP